MVDLHIIEWMSHKPEEFHMITEEVHEIVKNSPVKTERFSSLQPIQQPELW